MTAKPGDLSVTALYTSQVWAWGGLSYAHLFASAEAKRVFDTTNLALAAARMVNRTLAPLRHALLHRHTMIDHLLRESGCQHVIELAAGFSRRGTAATCDPDMHYTEIDLPHVIGRKRELLKRTEQGRAVLARPGLRLVEADVESVALEELGLPGEPVLVIAEGLLMYLTSDARRDLFTKVRKLAETTGELRFVFDLTPAAEEPEPGVAGRVLASAMRRSTGGRGFERSPRTREDIVTALHEAGFDDVAVLTASETARAWGLPDPDRRTRVVLFVASCAAGWGSTIAGR
ncbi:MAG: class I SAM-dependent methyltransferase [Pseudonocardiaceae bacterium]